MLKCELCGEQAHGAAEGCPCWWGIRDPERFVGRIIGRSGRTLDHHQRERLHQFLLIELWTLSTEFRPGSLSFSTWAGTTLPKRIIDWERSPEEGGRTKWQFADRTYERKRPEFLSLDHISKERPTGVRFAGERGLGGHLPSGALDATPDRSPDLMRVLGKGSSGSAGRAGEGGKEKAREAA